MPGVPGRALRYVAILTGLVAFAAARPQPSAPPRAVANDNRVPAGIRSHDTLVLRLVVQRADWYPEAETGSYLTVEAFGEEGKAPTIPAPLIRVETGTPVRAIVRNALPDSAIGLIGLATQPVPVADTLRIAPGATVEVTFNAGAPGTYFYRAVVGGKPDTRAGGEWETANGAFVVDPVGGSPPDRVLVMNIYSQAIDSAEDRGTLAINGKSWPHTERFALTVGDSARWRVLNGTIRNHPMHLHGFYFRIDAEGDGRASRDVPEPERMLAVTDNMASWSTRTFTWSPDRPGNWLFHCHLTFHVVAGARLDHVRGPDIEMSATRSVDPTQHMAGLVVGITVAPRSGESYERIGTPRRLDLFVNEGGPRGRMPRTFSYILQQGPVEPASDSVQIPGSLLVLKRGEPTDVVIHNRASEAVGVHWHGLELESWSDGVAGWSGHGDNLAPAIYPGDQFTARLSLPRAGTFIYHSHLDDVAQVTGGAIGPLLVLEPGEVFDPTRDHVYIAGWNGPGAPPPARLLMVNGDTAGTAPRELAAGITHRFRFINLGPALTVRYALLRDTAMVRWTPRAKDGADLPAARRVERQSIQAVAVGETYDFEVAPPPGEYVLVAGFGQNRTWRQRLVFR